MKKIVRTSLLALATILSFNAYAWPQNDIGCEKKKAALEKQLYYAEKYGNSYRIKGLKKALNNVEMYCNNNYSKYDGYGGFQDEIENKMDDIKDIKEDIQDKLEDIQDIKEEIQEAKLKGKLSKVAKKEAKLKKEQAELYELQKMLSELYKQ